MKPLKSQNYYEILGLPRNANPEEIQNAFEGSLQTFEEDSMAVYSLFNEEERGNIRGLINKAYRTLSDFELKKEYDRYLVDQDRQESFQRGRAPGRARPPGARSFTPTPDGHATPPAGVPRLSVSREPMAPAPEVKQADPQVKIDAYLQTVTEYNGEVLQQVRQLKGLSIEDVAEITKIRRTYVEYLESHQFEFLPAAIYVRGFVNIIAGLLDLPQQQVSQDYMKLYNKP